MADVDNKVSLLHMKGLLAHLHDDHEFFSWFRNQDETNEVDADANNHPEDPSKDRPTDDTNLENGTADTSTDDADLIKRDEEFEGFKSIGNYAKKLFGIRNPTVENDVESDTNNLPEDMSTDRSDVESEKGDTIVDDVEITNEPQNSDDPNVITTVVKKLLGLINPQNAKEVVTDSNDPPENQTDDLESGMEASDDVKPTHSEDYVDKSVELEAITTKSGVDEEMPAYMVNEGNEKEISYENVQMTTISEVKASPKDNPETTSIDKTSVTDPAAVKEGGFTDCSEYLVYRPPAESKKTPEEDQERERFWTIVLAVFLFLVILIAAGTGVATGVAYSGKRTQNVKPTESSGSSSTSTTVGSPNIIETPPIELIQVNVSLGLAREWMEAFDSPSSSHYQDLKNDIENIINNIFNQSLSTMDVYKNTEVDNFSPGFVNGSMITDVIVAFKDSPVIRRQADNGTLTDKDDILALVQYILQQLIDELITQAADSGELDAIDYITGSIQVDEPRIVLAESTTIEPTDAMTSGIGKTTTQSLQEFSTRLTTTNPLPVACREFEFECSNGECIYFFNKCDGTPHCSDNSDEMNCNEPSPSPITTTLLPVGCGELEFECGNGECIDVSSKCNDIQDCSDSSDEVDCTEPSPSPITTTLLPVGCGELEFECGNGECIDVSSKCNDIQDCSDNSDEVDCTECSVQCSNGICVSTSDQCDGYPHCGLDKESPDEHADCSYNCELYNLHTGVECSGWLPYSTTFFPNFITKNFEGYATIESAELHLQELYLSRSCNRKAVSFFCGIIFPECPQDNQLGGITICRGFCEHFVRESSCADAFEDVGLNLTAICRVLPTVPINHVGDFCTFR